MVNTMTDQPTPLSTLLAELDAKMKLMTPGPWRYVPNPKISRPQYDADREGECALVNAWPTLREGIEQLQQQLETSRMSEVEQAKRRSELGLEVVQLRALVARQRALLARVVVVMDGSWDVLPPGEEERLADELRNAVLAQEVPA